MNTPPPSEPRSSDLLEFRLDAAGLEQTVLVPRREIEELHLPLLRDWRARAAGLDRRLVVLLAGAPGSGKSTLAALWEALARTVLPAGPPLVALPFDGFHRSNAELARLEVALDGRRARGLEVKGAPETFDAEALGRALAQLHGPSPLRWPLYDRRIHEPVADALEVPSPAVAVVEGLYLLLDETPWRELTAHADHTVFLECSPEEAEARVVDRHRRAGRSPEEAVQRAAENDRRHIRRVLKARRAAELTLRPRPGGLFERTGTGRTPAIRGPEPRRS